MKILSSSAFVFHWSLVCWSYRLWLSSLSYTNRIREVKSKANKRSCTAGIFRGTLLTLHFSISHLLPFTVQCWVSFIYLLVNFFSCYTLGHPRCNKGWGDLFSLSLSSLCCFCCPWWFKPYRAYNMEVSILIKMVTKESNPHTTKSHWSASRPIPKFTWLLRSPYCVEATSVGYFRSVLYFVHDGSNRFQGRDSVTYAHFPNYVLDFDPRPASLISSFGHNLSRMAHIIYRNNCS